MQNIQRLVAEASAALGDFYPEHDVMGALGWQWQVAARQAGIID